LAKNYKKCIELQARRRIFAIWPGKTWQINIANPKVEVLIVCASSLLSMELNRESRVNFQPIYELAEIFVHSILGAPRNNIIQHFRFFGEKLLSYSHEYGYLDETRHELPNVLISLDLAIGSRIARLHSRVTIEKAEATQHQGEAQQGARHFSH
jgi:hypothetical protein